MQYCGHCGLIKTLGPIVFQIGDVSRRCSNPQILGQTSSTFSCFNQILFLIDSGQKIKHLVLLNQNLRILKIISADPTKTTASKASILGLKGLIS